jgi:hypothetical protein
MPVILRTPKEMNIWMTAQAAALKLSRPLPDGALRIVATGRKKPTGLSLPARLHNPPTT